MGMSFSVDVPKRCSGCPNRVDPATKCDLFIGIDACRESFGELIFSGNPDEQPHIPVPPDVIFKQTLEIKKKFLHNPWGKWVLTCYQARQTDNPTDYGEAHVDASFKFLHHS